MTFANLYTSEPIAASPMVDHLKSSASNMTGCSTAATTSMSVHGALSLKRRLSGADATTTSLAVPPLKRQRRVSAPYVLAAAAANASIGGGRVRTLATDFAALDALFALDFATFPSSSYGGSNGILAAPPKKRVTFNLKYCAAAAPAPLHPLCPDDTWYSAQDYHSFQLDCRRTVLAARQSLLDTGDFAECHEMTLCGVEHFLSPTLERERQQHVQHHVQRILSKLKQDKRAPRRLAMHHGSCCSW